MRDVLTFADYRTAYEGALTPRDAVAEVCRRLKAHDDPAVFITLRPEAELFAEADALAARRNESLPLYGIPVAVKDNIDVAGVPTTCACPAFAYTPAQDSAAVARLRAAGALIIGKTNLDQFATGLVGVRSPYGVPRNTFDASLVPGGSSSGSAVAVAAGIVPLALGTDTAGSGRVPAGLNNIVGLKPSLGLVSTSGLVPACRTLDCISIFALSVADAQSALEVIAGYDAADSYSRALSYPPMPSALRIGVPDYASRKFAGDTLSEAAFDAACALLDANTITPVDLSKHFETAALLYDGPWVAERYQAIRALIETTPDALHPVTRAITQKARNHSAADAFAGLYKLADLKRACEAIWRDVDMLVVPTYPRPRTRTDLDADPIGPNAELGTYTNFVNLLDLCALAVPGPFRSDGLPSGVTLIAPAGRDAWLASLGDALHRAADVTLGATSALLPAVVMKKEATADTIEIVAVGAHLSGLALNGELLAHGAHLARAAVTTKDYRLFALPGKGVARPGLLRVADGGGHAIACEVWTLPPEGFARFIASIPSPLSIGTLRLADGTTPKGFLVEAEATLGAQDISAYGGWRAYVTRGQTAAAS